MKITFFSVQIPEGTRRGNEKEIKTIDDSSF